MARSAILFVSLIGVMLIPFAAHSQTLTVETKRAQPRDTVSLSVSATGIADIGNITFTLEYNGTQLGFLGFALGDVLQVAVLAMNPPSFPDNSGLIRFSEVVARGISGDAELMKLTFIVGDTAQGNLLVTFKELRAVNSQLADISLTGKNGGFEVPAGAPRIALASSWNLVSWNVDTPSDSTHVILSPIKNNLVVALGFKQGGLTYDPKIPPEFNTLKTMDHLSGYWLKMTDQSTISLTGTPVNRQIPLKLDEGWNLVSYLPGEPDSVAHALASISDKLAIVLGFEGGGLTYSPSLATDFNTLKVLRPGFGYWIKTTGTDTLIYPPTAVNTSSAIILASTGLEKIEKSESNVTPTNEWINLWGDSISVKGRLLPAGTLIRAIDKDGILCGEFLVKIEGKLGLMPVYRDEPWTKQDEGAEAGEEVTLYIDDFKVAKGIRWTEFGDVINLSDVVTSLELAEIPREYILHQNYPNPFNPTTTIRYGLPVKTRVKAEVYNVLGQRIAELVDEEQSAGYHNIVWQAKTIASGVYFLRIHAEALVPFGKKEFIAVKKLMLLK